MTSQEMTGEALLARVLHRDGLMLVVDKPAGIAVHRHPRKSEGCLEDYFDALRYGLPRNPSLAHRLDRDTSGCLILGRHRKALEKLGLLFKQGRIDKTYWAVVEGHPASPEGLIDLPLGTLEPGRGWWMKVDESGMPSQTRWRVMGTGEADGRPLAFVAFEPLTGRTHQIRVHAAAMGWPILGDPVYGLHGAARAPSEHRRAPGAPLHLHAREIVVPLPKDRPTRVVAPVPAHMQQALAICGWPGEGPAAAQVAPSSADQVAPFSAG